MFTGLSAFPLTPFRNERIDFNAFEKLLSNLVEVKVDSICAMGSTGLYPYLRYDEFASVTRKTVEISGDIPVMVGVGALRTDEVLKRMEVAQKCSVDAVLIAPVSYHPLKDAEVFALFERAATEFDLPICVYENPIATKFTFSDDLYEQICQLPNIAAIKIPGMPFADETGVERLQKLRSIVPSTTAIGVSGDKYGVAGMAAGCDLWLSVVGGLFPKTIKHFISLVKSGETDAAIAASERLEQLWSLFANNNGGLRVVATAADILGFTEGNCLPHPLAPLNGEDRESLSALLRDLLDDSQF